MFNPKGLYTWDGICGNLKLIDHEKLLVDEKGTIYYKTQDGKLHIWCENNGQRLYSHLHHLWFITQGKAVRYINDVPA